jgi:AraC-like DNA-binding protein
MDLLSAVFRELRFESAAYRWLEPGRTFRLDFTEPQLRGVHIIARGGCELVFPDGDRTDLSAGDLVVVPRGGDHALRSDGSAGDTVVVCGAFLIGEPSHPVLRGLPRQVIVRGDDGRTQPWLGPLIDALSREAHDGGPGSDLVMARLSDALLLRALRHYSATIDHRGWLAALGDPYLAPVLAAVHADLTQPWTLSRMAATAGLPRTAFAARFTDRVGEPPMRYVTSLRMQRARTLLRDERITVTAAAARVGYRSEVGFAAAFKREVGVPPGVYGRSGLVPGDGKDEPAPRPVSR